MNFFEKSVFYDFSVVFLPVFQQQMNKGRQKADNLLLMLLELYRMSNKMSCLRLAEYSVQVVSMTSKQHF